MAKVLVLETDYESIGKAAEKVFEEFPLEVEGKTVLLNPNILGVHPPDSHIKTHPALIRALVNILKNAGADIIVGDNPGTHGYGAVEKCGKVSGIVEASQGHFENLGTEVDSVGLDGKNASVNVSSRILDSDIVISVPKLKTHTFTRITGAIKNCFGYLVGGDKARIHTEFSNYRAFSDVLVDIYRIRIPDLVITDAVVGIQGNGPANKSYYRAGKILASDNGVCHDAVMTSMMRMRPRRVRMLEYANELGLGEIDLSRIEVEGPAESLKVFRHPVPGLPQIFGGTWIGAFFPDIGHPHFDVDPKLCVSCGDCRDACPGRAIEIVDKLPQYDYSKCISCYCCMELCDPHAISLHDTLSTRIYRRMGYIQ